MLLEGLHIPLTTPFHPDGRLNLPKLTANVVRYSKSPAAGLVVLGASGEPTLLTDDETHDVLRAAAHAAAPEKSSSQASPATASARHSPSPSSATSCTTTQFWPVSLRSSPPIVRPQPQADNPYPHSGANSCFTSRPLPTAPRSPSFYSATAATASPWKPQSSSPPIPTSSACWTPRPAPPRSNRLFAAPRRSNVKSPSRLSSVPSPRA